MQFEKAKKFILSKLRKELPAHLKYHSVAHVKDVYDSAERIGMSEGIKGDDLILLLTAALFHDSGFLINQQNHEQLSCDFAQAHLPEFGYSAAQIESICSMIMATKLPQTPRNLMEQVICDADLDYLGRDDFFKIGNYLFSELSLYGIIRNETEWNQLQIKFLEAHHYFTATALSSRQQKKEKHLQILKTNTGLENSK